MYCFIIIYLSLIIYVSLRTIVPEYFVFSVKMDGTANSRLKFVFILGYLAWNDPEAGRVNRNTL